MDILYYSNFCKHSQKVLQFFAKNNLTDKVNFICIDKRYKNPENKQMYVLLENGNKIIIPPNIHSVPALLQVKNNYNAVFGMDIIECFKSFVKEENNRATMNNGEPLAFALNNSVNSNIVSEQYTFYSMTPEELSAKGKGENRQMYNYVPAHHETLLIETPPDNYRPDKLSTNVTIDAIQQQRNDDVAYNRKNPLSM